MAASSPFDRRRWTDQDARFVLDASGRSGKRLRVFAEEHGLTNSACTSGVAESPLATVPRSGS